MSECNADLGHPCDANDGEPCERCAAAHAYWKDQWQLHGRNEYTREEIMDAYSDPTERAKRDILLDRLG